MLEVKNVYKDYSRHGSIFGKKNQTILAGVSFFINQGKCMGLVGESGSGKSTLSRLILGLEQPSCGEILMENESIADWRKKHRGQMSVVFQDYTTSVNSRFTVQEAITEPLLALKSTNGLRSHILELLDRVELSTRLLKRYPHELSGGQMQRVCLARAISTQPRFILFDEALSSLDVSVQSQILELLSTLKDQFNMTYLFIAHDLQTVTWLCDQVLFLHQGRIVEQLNSRELYKAQNGYAKRLLASVNLFSGNPF